MVSDVSVRKYIVSTFGKTLTWSGAEAYGLFALTNVVGLPGPTAGLLVLIFMAWAAAADLLAGALFDRYRRAGGAATPFYTVSAVLASAFFALSFAPIPHAWPRVLLAAAAGLGFRTAYSAMDIPHNALISQLGSASGRMRLGSLRLAATLLGGLCATTLAGWLVVAGSPGLDLNAVAYGITIAVAAGGLFIVFVPKADAAPPAGAPEAGTGQFDLRFFLFLLGEVNVAIIAGLIARNIAFLGAYVFRSPDWAAWAFLLFLTGKLAAVFVWPPLVRSRNLAAWSAAGFVLCALTALTLACAPPQYLLMNAGLFAFGFSMGGVNQMSWTLISTLVRKTSSRSLYFGVFSAVGKIGGGLSGFALGLLLGDAANGTAAVGPIYAGSMWTALACAIVGVASLGLLAILGLGREAKSVELKPLPQAT